ncbi:hypothetical protein Q7P37_004241 [Cladosporium fusiforme]
MGAAAPSFIPSTPQFASGLTCFHVFTSLPQPVTPPNPRTLLLIDFFASLPCPSNGTTDAVNRFQLLLRAAAGSRQAAHAIIACPAAARALLSTPTPNSSYHFTGSQAEDSHLDYSSFAGHATPPGGAVGILDAS